MATYIDRVTKEIIVSGSAERYPLATHAKIPRVAVRAAQPIPVHYRHIDGGNVDLTEANCSIQITLNQ